MAFGSGGVARPCGKHGIDVRSHLEPVTTNSRPSRPTTSFMGGGLIAESKLPSAVAYRHEGMLWSFGGHWDSMGSTAS